MSSGGGSDPVSDALKGVNSAIKWVSSYDPSTGQQSTHGSVWQAPDEIVGGVTGRNQSRAALNVAKDQYNKAQQDAQNLINQQNWNRMQSDKLASGTAGAARATGVISSGANFTNSTPLGLGAAAGRDFLGL